MHCALKKESPGISPRALLGGDYLLSHFRSTIGVVRLNFSVRNGKRWDPHAIITLMSSSGPRPGSRGGQWCLEAMTGTPRDGMRLRCLLHPCSCSRAETATARLVTLLDGPGASAMPAYGLSGLFLLLRGSQPRESLRVISTARLNVSPRLHLPPIDVVVFNDPHGDLILWLASRLDAFSAYPYQTRLPGGAPGGTTGRPEVCPSRSSRTSDRATQISRAHNR